jgi:hypothetical protein
MTLDKTKPFFTRVICTFSIALSFHAVIQSHWRVECFASPRCWHAPIFISIVCMEKGTRERDFRTPSPNQGARKSTEREKRIVLTRWLAASAQHHNVLNAKVTRFFTCLF